MQAPKRFNPLVLPECLVNPACYKPVQKPLDTVLFTEVFIHIYLSLAPINSPPAACVY